MRCLLERKHASDTGGGGWRSSLIGLERRVIKVATCLLQHPDLFRATTSSTNNIGQMKRFWPLVCSLLERRCQQPNERVSVKTSEKPAWKRKEFDEGNNYNNNRNNPSSSSSSSSSFSLSSSSPSLCVEEVEQFEQQMAERREGRLLQNEVVQLLSMICNTYRETGAYTTLLGHQLSEVEEEEAASDHTFLVSRLAMTLYDEVNDLSSQQIHITGTTDMPQLPVDSDLSSSSVVSLHALKVPYFPLDLNDTGHDQEDGHRGSERGHDLYQSLMFIRDTVLLLDNLSKVVIDMHKSLAEMLVSDTLQKLRSALEMTIRWGRDDNSPLKWIEEEAANLQGAIWED